MSAVAASPMVQITSELAYECVEASMQAGLVPLIAGSPGIGKSWNMMSLAKKFNLCPIDVRLSQMAPEDLNGFPAIDKARQRAGYLPMDTFPIEGEELPLHPGEKEKVKADPSYQPKRYNGWMLFFDELTSTPRAVQAAAYKIILDKMVGNHKLHENCAITSAGNLDTDNAIVEEMSSALQSRIVHFEQISHTPSWLNWAAEFGIDNRVTSYIRFMPENLNRFDPNSNTSEKAYACERTWHFVHRYLQVLEIEARATLPCVAGCISHGLAREFIEYTKIFKDLPTMDQILRAPKSAIVPDDPGKQYAMCGSLAQNATAANLPKIMQYLESYPHEMQVVCLTETGQRHPTLRKDKNMLDWMIENADHLF